MGLIYLILVFGQKRTAIYFCKQVSHDSLIGNFSLFILVSVWYCLVASIVALVLYHARKGLNQLPFVHVSFCLD